MWERVGKKPQKHHVMWTAKATCVAKRDHRTGGGDPNRCFLVLFPCEATVKCGDGGLKYRCRKSEIWRHALMGSKRSRKPVMKNHGQKKRREKRSRQEPF